MEKGIKAGKQYEVFIKDFLKMDAVNKKNPLCKDPKVPYYFQDRKDDMRTHHNKSDNSFVDFQNGNFQIYFDKNLYWVPPSQEHL